MAITKNGGKRMKREGITLVALVVTIIVLLILAGIVISLTIGNQGVFNKAQMAKFQTEVANMQEQITMQVADQMTGNLGVAPRYFGTLQDVLGQNAKASYEGKLEVENNRIVYTDECSVQEIQWLQKIGIDHKSDYTLVRDKQSLLDFATKVNSGDDYTNKTIYLSKDIDLGTTIDLEEGMLLSGEAYTPMGSIERPFQGTFDGNGFKIKGIYVKSSDAENIGLFGVLGENAIVRNLTIEDSYLEGYMYIGAVSGQCYGTVENVINKAKLVSNYDNVGGITGKAIGAKIDNCINEGEISGVRYAAGGIVGWNTEKSEITNCSNHSQLIVGGRNVGGIIGSHESESIVEDCNNYAIVKSNAVKQADR